MDILFSLIVFAAIIIALVNEYYSHKLKVVPMPTLPWVRAEIVSLLQQETIKEDAVIYELGSGWGGLAYHIAKAFPRARVYGFELSPFPFLASWLWRRRQNLTFKRQDVLQLDMGVADVIVVYLMPELLALLRPHFEAQLKSGALIVASGFAIEGWTPDATIPLPRGLEKEIYIYRR